MYKVIDGHRYDTGTAKVQAVYGCGPVASRHITETLYRTKTGQYFLHGEGGSLTKYAEAAGNGSWRSGQKVIPLTEDAARAWAKEHCDGQTYGRIFESRDDGPVRQFNIKLGAADAERFEAIKRRTGRTYTELVSEWIREQHP